MMRAKLVGRKVVNKCVSYTIVGDGEYALVRTSDKMIIGKVKRVDLRFEASVGEHHHLFRTMADLILWASNLVYDGKA